MFKFRELHLVEGAVVVMLLTFLGFCIHLKPDARLMPLIIISATLVCTALYLFSRIKKGWQPGKETEEAGVAFQDELKAFLWFAFAFLVFYLFGLYLGSLLFIFIMLRFKASKSYVFSGLSSLICMVCLYLLFTMLLNLKIYQGVIVLCRF